MLIIPTSPKDSYNTLGGRVRGRPRPEKFSVIFYYDLNRACSRYIFITNVHTYIYIYIYINICNITLLLQSLGGTRIIAESYQLERTRIDL